MGRFYQSWHAYTLGPFDITNLIDDSSTIQKRIDNDIMYYWSKKGAMRLFQRPQGLNHDTFTFCDSDVNVADDDNYCEFLQHILTDTNRPILFYRLQVIEKLHSMGIHIFVIDIMNKTIEQIKTGYDKNENPYNSQKLWLISNSKSVDAIINGCFISCVTQRYSDRLELPHNFSSADFEETYLKQIEFNSPSIEELYNKGGQKEHIKNDVFKINHTNYIIYWNDNNTIALYKAPKALILKDYYIDSDLLAVIIEDTERPIRCLGSDKDPNVQLLTLLVAYTGHSVVTLKKGLIEYVIFCKQGYEGEIKMDFNEYEVYESFLAEMPLKAEVGTDLFNFLVSNINEAKHTPPYKLVKIKPGFNKIELNGIPSYYWYEDQSGEILLGSSVTQFSSGIKIVYTAKSRHASKDLRAGDLYLDILNDNKTILFSDNSLSEKGFSIWKYLFDRGNNISVYDMENNTTTVVNSISDLEQVYSTNPADKKYIYKISKPGISEASIDRLQQLAGI